MPRACPVEAPVSSFTKRSPGVISFSAPISYDFPQWTQPPQTQTEEKFELATFVRGCLAESLGCVGIDDNGDRFC